MTDKSDRSVSGPLKQLGSFIGDFKSVTAWVGKIALMAPLTDILFNLGPPWPSRIGVAFIASLIEIAVLIYAFEFWRRRGADSIKSVQLKMKVGLVGAASILAFYLILFSLFVEDRPDSWHRSVKGFIVRPDVQEVLDDRSASSPEDFWSKVEDDATKVWMPWTVYLTRVVLLLLWMGFWIAFSIGVAAFVALQWRRYRPPKNRL